MRADIHPFGKPGQFPGPTSSRDGSFVVTLKFSMFIENLSLGISVRKVVCSTQRSVEICIFIFPLLDPL